MLFRSCIGKDKVIEEIAKVGPSEIILNEVSFKEDLRNIATMGNIYINENFDEAYLDLNILDKYFSEDYLSTLRFDEENLIKTSLCILLNYIYNTQKQITSNINAVNIYNPQEYMVLDLFTRINLELTQTIRGSKKKGSLLHVLEDRKSVV